ncbi:hypothetical protein CLW00_1178 [Mongoliibacter ruber]|uniref:Uncharacterized protein n=2 Tax=Mongoliibacter ruber TaxID=1750599 RepID=A0A2T0WDF7_9BACT|nr:hypothetical protein CLW00_1178 [Mongoliibacter ruber]
MRGRERMKACPEVFRGSSEFRDKIQDTRDKKQELRWVDVDLWGFQNAEDSFQ